MNDDLMAFIRARLAEREREVAGHDGSYNDMDECWGIHADPQQVLAEVDAQRRIIAECVVLNDEVDDFRAGIRARNVLRLLAVPYRDHHDYRPEWAPGA